MIARHWSEQNLCGHERTGWVRRILSNGTIHVVRACADCGHTLTVAQPFSAHPDRAGYPELLPHPEKCACHARPALAASPVSAPAATTSTRPDYGEYLRSPQWRERRAYFLARAMHRCQLCKRKGGPGGQGLDVHHSDYSRLGAELEIDVIVLCRDCHGHYHDRIGRAA